MRSHSSLVTFPLGRYLNFLKIAWSPFLMQAKDFLSKSNSWVTTEKARKMKWSRIKSFSEKVYTVIKCNAEKKTSIALKLARITFFELLCGGECGDALILFLESPSRSYKTATASSELDVVKRVRVMKLDTKKNNNRRTNFLSVLEPTFSNIFFW